MLTNIKLLYPSLSDGILDMLEANAQAYVLEYCNLDELPTTLDGVITRMVQEDANRMYAEGLNSESTGGGSVSYNDDYSPAIYNVLKKHKRIRTAN